MKVTFKDKQRGELVEVPSISRITRDGTAYKCTKENGYDEFYKRSRFEIESIEEER